MDKIKILQINKLYYPVTGGIERVVQQIAEGLNAITDMEVLVCSNTKNGSIENINGIKVIRVPSIAMYGNIPIPFGLTRKLRKLMRDRDIIHVHMPYPFADLACLLSGYKGKIVVWWHSDVVRQKKMMLLYKPLMKRFLDRVDTIIVATKGHIEGSEYLKDYRNKCIIIPFGVDLKIEEKADEYVKNTTSIVSYDNKLSYKSIRFLFVGRLVYYKGCSILLEAFSKVDNAELIIIGSGNMKHELQGLVEILNIENRVQFLGEVSEELLQEEYKRCDVFVLPSIAKSEAFGLVQIEAMAFGKPIINTNISSGVPYVSIDKITGLTVPPSDVEALAEAMRWMVLNEEERLAMGRRARERMKTEYRMGKMLSRVLEVYDN